MGFLRQYLFAVRSFTRVPVSGPLARWAGTGADAPDAGAAHFPGVGWLVGVVACASFAVLGLALPDSPFTAMVAAVASMAASLVLTGAAHEIALARFADAAGGTTTPGIRAAGIGAHGVLALALVALGKVSLLAVIAAQSPAAVMAALLAGQVVSRFWPLLLGRGVPSTAPSPGAHPFAGRVPARALGIAAAWTAAAPVVAWLAGGAGFAVGAVVVSAAVLGAMRRFCMTRLPGQSDEALGAAQQLCEIGFYLGAAIGLGLA